MSVIVRDMEMPKECEYCGFCRFYPENGNVWCNAKNIILKTKWKEPNWTHLDVKRPEWCPLVELPEKHGRLIDADFVIEKASHEAKAMDEPFKSNFDVLIEWIVDKTPTVIEAEGSERCVILH